MAVARNPEFLGWSDERDQQDFSSAFVNLPDNPGFFGGSLYVAVLGATNLEADN